MLSGILVFFEQFFGTFVLHVATFWLHLASVWLHVAPFWLLFKSFACYILNVLAPFKLLGVSTDDDQEIC
jgi:hypothetical protein